MKYLLKLAIIGLFLLKMVHSYAQADETVYQEKKVWRVAVFPLTYSDVPANFLDSFPDKGEIERLIFHNNIQDYFKFISNDEFVLVGDVYDYTINPGTFWTSAGGQLMSDQQLLDGIDLNAPGFNADDYDLVLFLSGHDATMSSPSNVSLFTYTINGTTYTDDIGLILYYQIGFIDRDPVNFYQNSWEVKKQYLIPLGGGLTEEEDVWYNLSQTESTCNHELGHAMGIWSHSYSSTNGAFPIDSPEIPNNDDFLDYPYGNSYCLMGTHQFSPSLNGYFRNVIGLLPQDEVVKVDDYGTFQVTIDPINTVSNNRHVEVLLPYSQSVLGFKNAGYGMEVRSNSSYDTLLNHPQLIGNIDGVFVHKISDLQNLLLDMSPTANAVFSWGQIPDITDVVLKPGMTYENNAVKFENVIANLDGSFTLDVTIKALKTLTPEPTIDNVSLNGTNNVHLEWTNNHLSSGNTSQIYVEYRCDTTHIWRKLDSTVNTATNYTTSFVYSGISGIEFRVKVDESASNHESKYSNLGVYECNVRIEDLIESPISCIHVNDGQIEVLASGGSGVLEYSIDNLAFQTSNTLNNLSSGIYSVHVKDENGCSAESMSNSIWEPEHILVLEEYSGDTLTLIATGGTGIYQYQVNGGAWSNSKMFVNISPGYTFEVKDRNGCAYSDVLSLEETKKNDQIVIYPNPADSWFKINVSQFDRVELSDLNGKLIRTYLQEDIHSIIGVEKGVYLVTIYRDNSIFDTKRLIIF